MSVNTQTLLTKSGITIDYNDPATQFVSFDNGTFSIDKGLSVENSTNLAEKLTVTKAGVFENTLRVDGAFILDGAVTVEAPIGSSLIVNGSSRFNGSAHLYNTLIVDKKATFNSTIDVVQATRMNSTLIVGELAELKNTTFTRAQGNALEVNGRSRLFGTVDISTSMNVADPTNFNAKFEVNGPSEMNNAVVITKSGALALTVTGTTNLQGVVTCGSSLSVADHSQMNSSFTVHDAANITNSLTITKDTGDALSVSGQSNLVGPASFGSALTVADAATLQSTLSVLKKAILSDALDVYEAAYLYSSLTVEGFFDPRGGIQLSSSGGGLTIGGSTNVTGAVQLDSSLEVEGSTILNANLSVRGHGDFNQTVITLDPSLGYALTVNGSTKLNGTTDVSSSMTVSSFVTMLSTVNVFGQTNLHDAIDVSREVLMNSSLQVDKLANLKDGIIISRVSAGDALSVVGSVNVSSSANLGSSINVIGAVHLLSSLEVENTSVLNSTLHITHLLGGNALTVAGDVSLDNIVNIQDSLTVSKIVNMNSSIVVAKSSIFNDGVHLSSSSGSTLIVAGSSNFSGSTIFGSSLEVVGKNTMNNILSITGKTTLSDNLDVTGAAHLLASLTANSSMTFNESYFSSTLSVTGLSKFKNDVEMNSILTVANDAHLSTVVITKTGGGRALYVVGKSVITGDVTIDSGSLTVDVGDITTLSNTTFEVRDNAILIGDDNQDDVVASGIIMKYMSTNTANGTSSVRYGGIKRVPVTGEFAFFKDSLDQIPNSDSLPILIPITAVSDATDQHNILVAATVPLKESTLSSLNDAISSVAPKLSAYNNAVSTFNGQSSLVANALALKNSKNNDVSAANQLVISKRADYDAALHAARTVLAAPYLPDVNSTLSSLNAAIAMEAAKNQIYNDTLLVQNNNARMGYGEYSTWSLGGSKPIDRVYVNVRPQAAADFGPREVKLLGSTNNGASWTLLSETVDSSGIVNYVSQEPPTYWTHFRVVYIEFNNSPGYMYNGKARIMLACEKYNGGGSLFNFTGKVTASSSLDFDGSFYYQGPANYDNNNVYSGEKYTLYYGGNGPTSQQISASVSAANSNVQAAISAKNTAQGNYDAALALYNDALATSEGSLRSTEITNTYSVWDSAVVAAASAQSAYDTAASDYSSVVQAANLSSLTSNIAAALSELEPVQSAKNAAQAAYDAALLIYNNAVAAREQAIVSATEIDYSNMEINAGRLRKTDTNFARIVAASFTCTSDARLKKNIVPLDGALDSIDEFNGVYHDWNNENQN